MDPSKHLYLTGYRGTGKSSVAAFLARRLKRPLIDLDQLIEASAGTTIREIFADGGEPRFRSLESAALEIAAGSDPAVIALGGGAVLRKQNRELVRRTGRCVWLTATAETIHRRITADAATAENRPALTSLDSLAEIKTLLEQRHECYASTADDSVSTEGKSVAEIAEEIISVVSGGNGLPECDNR